MKVMKFKFNPCQAKEAKTFIDIDLLHGESNLDIQQTNRKFLSSFNIFSNDISESSNPQVCNCNPHVQVFMDQRGTETWLQLVPLEI